MNETIKNRIIYTNKTDKFGNLIITTAKVEVKFTAPDALLVRIGKYEYYIDNSTGENIYTRTKISNGEKKPANGAGRPKTWGLAEEQALKEKYPTMPNKQLAVFFNCSIATITSKANDLGLKKANHFWSDAEIESLISLQGKCNDREMAAAMGRTRWGIVEMKRKLRAEGRL